MSDFHMVVCVKAVPGSTEVKMDPKTNTIVRDGKQAVINPFDASALECALALKDDFIGFGMDVRVTVVSMGSPATESLLRDCIARFRHVIGVLDFERDARIGGVVSIGIAFEGRGRPASIDSCHNDFLKSLRCSIRWQL